MVDFLQKNHDTVAAYRNFFPLGYCGVMSFAETGQWHEANAS